MADVNHFTKAMTPSGPNLTLQITGTEDGGDIRFDEFIKQLESFKRALRETERIVAKDHKDHSVYYRVVDLRHSSPATIVLEPVGQQSQVVAGVLFNALTQIQEHAENPPGFDLEALVAIKEVTNLFGKSVSSLSVSRNGTSVAVLPSLAKNVDVILGPDMSEMGDITGMLHQISLHGEQHHFTVYPTWGDFKVHCKFSNAMREEAVSAVDKYVKVYGRLKYKRLSDYPYEMQAQSIEVMPPASELPSLFELRGIVAGAIDDQSSEDFVRELRNEW